MQGCHKSIISGMRTIFGVVYESLKESIISNTIGDIYCVTYDACWFTQIQETNGNVYGIGFSSMRESIINNSISNATIEKIYAI